MCPKASDIHKPLPKEAFDPRIYLLSGKLRAKVRPWPEEHRRWCGVAGGLPEVMPLAICEDIVIGVMHNGQQILVHRQNLLGLNDGMEALGKSATRSVGASRKPKTSTQEKSYAQMASALSKIPKARLMVLLGIVDDKETKKD